MTVKVEDILIWMIEVAQVDPLRIREFVKQRGVVEIHALLTFCQENEGTKPPKSNYGLVHQDLVNNLGEKLGFKVTPGDYTSGADGVWEYKDVKIIVESKTFPKWLEIKQVNDYVIEQEATSGLVICSSFRKDHAMAAKGYGNVRLSTSDGLCRLVESKEAGVLSTDQVVSILVPQEAVLLDDLIDLIYGITEPAEDRIIPPPKPPEWTYEEVERYLNEIKERQRKYTYAYYKVLAQTEGRISKEEVLSRMGEELGEEVSGYQLAGVQAGIKMTVIDKLEKERLDRKDGWGRHFWLSDEYREFLKRYFAH